MGRAKRWRLGNMCGARQLNGTVWALVVLLGAAVLTGGQALPKREHPYLFMTASDIAVLRQRANTPAGQEVIDRLKFFIDIVENGFRDDGNPNTPHEHEEGFYAFGAGLLYHLYGDKVHLDLCNALVDKAFERGFRWRTMGVAMTYDLMYSEWDQAMRDKVFDYLDGRRTPSAQDPAAPPDLNAYIVNPPPCGLAGLAILHDHSDPDAVIEQVERTKEFVIRWARAGIGDLGWRNEWGGYPDALWGALPFVEAYRNVVGDTTGLGMFDMAAVLGLYTEGWWQVEKGGYGPWCMGASPRKYWPGMRWWFEKHETLCIGSPWHAFFALKHMLSVEGKCPDDMPDVYPLFLYDKGMGASVFRKGWDGDLDIHGFYDGKSRSAVAPATAGDFHVAAFDSKIFEGRRRLYGGAEFNIASSRFDDRVHTAPNVMRFQDPDSEIFPKAGGHVTHFQGHADGSVVISMVLDNFVRGEIHPSWGWRKYRPMEDGRNLGITHLRSFGADYSEAGGVPALFALVDRVSGNGDRLKWQQTNLTGRPLEVPQEASGDAWPYPKRPIEEQLIAAGVLGDKLSELNAYAPTNTITVQNRNSENVYVTARTTYAAPEGLRISIVPSRHAGRITKAILLATGGDEFFSVTTVQRGKVEEPPEVKVTGSGLDAVVTVGEQTVSFDGTKIVFGKVAPTAVDPAGRTDRIVRDTHMALRGDRLVVNTRALAAVLVVVTDPTGRRVAELPLGRDRAQRAVDLRRLGLGQGFYVVTLSDRFGRAIARRAYCRLPR